MPQFMRSSSGMAGPGDQGGKGINQCPYCKKANTETLAWQELLLPEGAQKIKICSKHICVAEGCTCARISATSPKNPFPGLSVYCKHHGDRILRGFDVKRKPLTEHNLANSMPDMKMKYPAHGYPSVSDFTNGTKHPTNEHAAGKNYEQFNVFSRGTENPSPPMTSRPKPPPAATSSSSPQNASGTQVPVSSSGIKSPSVPIIPRSIPPQAATSSASSQYTLRCQEVSMRPLSDPCEEAEDEKKKRKDKRNARRRVSGANVAAAKAPTLRKETRNHSAHEAVNSSGTKQPKILVQKGRKMG